MKATTTHFLKISLFSLAILTGLPDCLAQGISAGVYMYPAKGQSKDQQAKDEQACYEWARGQSGVDPLNMTATPVDTDPDVHSKKKIATNTVGGAAVGAGVGAIAGDAGTGAAIGATAGAVRGVHRRRKAKKEAKAASQEQATAIDESKMHSYRQAFSACMEGKGYTVK
jgi:hypothetical protein